MKLHEKAELSKLIIAHGISQYPKLFTACSFGKDSIVVANLVQQVDPTMSFVGIDTGYEFDETLQFAEQLIKDLEMDFTWAKPSAEDIARIEEKYGEEFVVDGQSKCCEMKLPAISKVLPEYDAWITGIRRDETERRANTKLIEEGQIMQINPIAFWTEEDVWAYIREHNLAYHPLYEEGYKSLGCKPCTTSGAVQSGGGRQGQFERAGK